MPLSGHPALDVSCHHFNACVVVSAVSSEGRPQEEGGGEGGVEVVGGDPPSKGRKVAHPRAQRMSASTEY